MFNTVIKYDIIDKKDLNFLNKILKEQEYFINPSAKEDNYGVVYFCDKNSIKNISVNKIFHKINKELISIVENVYQKKVLNVAGNCILKYTKDRFIGIHRDWQEDDEWVIKNKKETVHLSSIFYLNDNYLRRRTFFL